MNPNQALWERGDFTRIADTMRDSGEALVPALQRAPGTRVSAGLRRGGRPASRQRVSPFTIQENPKAHSISDSSQKTAGHPFGS